jgi:predicted transposase/invertase (TIGR01784 family)
MKSSHPHDVYVRKIFSGLEESKEFFRLTLPPKIVEIMDLDQLEDTQESFINEDLQESRTDKHYKIPLLNGKEVYMYLLFEHKSYLDLNIYTQLLRYLSEIYQWQRNTNGKYRPVLPFVFYHGEKGWNLGKDFLDTFELSKQENTLIEFIPNFSIHLYHLKSDDPDFPTDLISLKLLLRILQHIRDDPDKLLAALRQTSKDLSHEKLDWKRVAILKAILTYMDRAREDAERYYDVEIYREVEKEYMTYLEKIEERGIQKGIVKGIEQGIEKKAIDDARLMKVKGYPISDILEITGLSESQLKEHGIV